MRSSRHCVSWSAWDLAILAVDLAPGKQAAVVCDHHSVVLGRPVFTGSAWCIEQILAEPAAAPARFAGLVLNAMDFSVLAWLGQQCCSRIATAEGDGA